MRFYFLKGDTEKDAVNLDDQVLLFSWGEAFLFPLVQPVDYSCPASAADLTLAPSPTSQPSTILSSV